MLIAITGASGYIGDHLTEYLSGQGHQVRRIPRGPGSDPRALWDPAARWIREGAFDGAHAVIHLSGVSIAAKRWTAARRSALRSSRIESTEVLARHLAGLANGPRVLVTASAVGYYGDAGDAMLTEASPKGSGFLADLVADWEAAAAPAREAGVRVVHARFGPVLGRDAELLRRVLPPFRMGLGGTLGNGRQWFPWVAIDDLVRAVEFAITSDLDGPVNVVAPGAVRNKEFTSALGRQLRRPTIFPVPKFALALLFGGDLASEALLSSQRVQPRRLEAAGFTFQTPTIEQALREAMQRPGAPHVARGAA